jgi:hypothetical protein
MGCSTTPREAATGRSHSLDESVCQENTRCYPSNRHVCLRASCSCRRTMPADPLFLVHRYRGADARVACHITGPGSLGRRRRFVGTRGVYRPSSPPRGSSLSHLLFSIRSFSLPLFSYPDFCALPSCSSLAPILHSSSGLPNQELWNHSSHRLVARRTGISAWCVWRTRQTRVLTHCHSRRVHLIVGDL